MKRWFLLFVTAVTLAGCPNAAELAAADDNTCRGYGYIVGTDQYAQCRERQDLARQQAAAEGLDRLNNALAAANGAYANAPPPPPTLPPQVHCTTVGLGGGMSTTDCR
jgi:hypothetical protein